MCGGLAIREQNTSDTMDTPGNWYLFAYSRFAYFRPKSGVSPTHKKLYLGIKVMSNYILMSLKMCMFGPCQSDIWYYI